ncbi:uncharacterized protein FOMMEDRAFT_170237 [Fomitiporia mediterranea MF3/22]|uniref:uncharacterized protein n=1 Tax=Fomitiporia mediterranea (strain MF3/22) TaxID=694068 RepID=UPI0004409108|nr:uncharacterized protein FOMMEDRAFT_170237 [Fomitiporia mediterranea MF3/22]EJC99567.1 hypothetical protein FOMMEDRAFT_170237 [Fomitiporia mediterranea MF3/22]
MSTMESTASSAAQVMPRRRLSQSSARVCNHCECHDHTSIHASPHSSHSGSLPSPPDSPPLDPYTDFDLDSISSFPSGSSSVFFSSSAGSPHSQPRQQEHVHDSGPGLIIPSLTLPSALQHPTPYGQTLGDLSLLLVGPSGSGKTALAEFLADADDVVDSVEWEDIQGGRVLRVSTDWIEEHDAHGLERFEGTANVSFTELDGFDSTVKPESVAERILEPIHDVFRDVRDQTVGSPSSPLLHSLLSSSHSPLYTALIYVTATPLTQQDCEIISALSSAIPVVPFCTTSLSSALTPFSRGLSSQPKLSSFQPHSQLSLRTGLFRAPQTVAALRAEAADRFMRWREVERAIEDIAPPYRTSAISHAHGFAANRRSTITQYTGNPEAVEKWSKAAWETMLSEDVARRLQHDKINSSSGYNSLSNSVLFTGAPCFSPALDPLHFRSLVLLSMSLLSPRPPSLSQSPRLKTESATLDDTLTTARPSLSRSQSRRGKGGTDAGNGGWRVLRWSLALFCAGIGIGCVLSALA